MPRQKPAGLAIYKRELRRAIAKNRIEPEVHFLNITAMMDMMTIILVFLLKSLSNSPASLPQSQDLQLPKSILTTERLTMRFGGLVAVGDLDLTVRERAIHSLIKDAHDVL